MLLAYSSSKARLTSHTAIAYLLRLEGVRSICCGRPSCDTDPWVCEARLSVSAGSALLHAVLDLAATSCGVQSVYWSGYKRALKRSG